jgi:carboxyl-terminal processing protease
MLMTNQLNKDHLLRLTRVITHTIKLATLTFFCLHTANTYAASPCPTDWEVEICQLKDAVETIKKDSYTPIDIHEFLNQGIKRTVDTLTHGQFMDKTDYADMWKTWRADGYVGIGVVVGEEGDGLRVYQVLDNSPAEKADIHPNDLITEADGESFRGKTFKEMTESMAGLPNTVIKITVQRMPKMQKTYFNITRAKIKSETVYHRIVAPNYGWVRIASFDENVVAKTVDALQDLAKTEPNLKGLILDLRNNGGGSLSAAVGIVSIFVQGKQKAVLIKGNSTEGERYLYTTLDDYKTSANTKDGVTLDPLANLPAIYKTIPLVVLVHHNTVSAPELVSGSLQDLKRATIIGETTFGKGSVQTVSPLINDTGLRLTTANYFTPSGCPINGYGVTPDYFVNERKNGDPDDVLNFHEVDYAHPKYEGIDPNNPLEKIRKERVKKRTEVLTIMNHHNQVLPPPILAKTYSTATDYMFSQALRYLQNKNIDQKQGKASDYNVHTLCGTL